MTEDCFVFSSVGSDLTSDYKNAVFKSWQIDQYQSGAVVYDANVFPYDTYFKKIEYQEGFKFPNLFYFDSLYNIIDSYKYIAVFDDDLLFNQHGSISYCIDMMNKHSLSVCSLSNDNKKSKSPYAIMKSQPCYGPRCDIVTFCEMGMMVFERSFLQQIRHDYHDHGYTFTDYGFDRYIANLATKYGHKIGIIRHLSFSNPKKPPRDYGLDSWENYNHKFNFELPRIIQRIPC